MSYSVEVVGKTDVGCVRTNNEDNLGFDTRLGVFIVCDGMGGMAAGEVASKMGVDCVLNYFREAQKIGQYPQVGAKADGYSPAANALNSAIHLANQAIYEAAAANMARKGMGSTIVTVLVHDQLFSIGHVGDSRIYLLRDGEFRQLTNDHSLVMEQVRRGYITLEQAQKSEMQNIILRALGSEEAVEADIEDLVAVPGDLLLMTSDGLTRHVRDEEILQILQAPGDLEHACNDLVQTAKDRGGDDNITCLLVRIVDRPWYQNILNKLFFGEAQWQNSI